MGLNTTVLVLNDALGQIEKDPEFGKKLAAAIKSHGNAQVDVHAGYHCVAATVIETHHADMTAVVGVGGNIGLVIDTFDTGNGPERTDLLRKLAALKK
jgi:hypothetical protein